MTITSKHDKEKIKRRMRKLLALAERGVGGEKDNANRMLKKLMLKHDITADSLISENKKRHWFKHGTYPQKRLLVAIICSVCDTQECLKRGRFTLGIDCTEYQRAQIELQWSVYKSALKEQIQAMVTAFIWKNEIRSKSGHVMNNEQLSEKDKERQRAASAIYHSIQRTSINPALEQRSE